MQVIENFHIISPFISRLVEMDEERTYEILQKVMLYSLGTCRRKEYPRLIKELEKAGNSFPDGGNHVADIVLSLKKQLPGKVLLLEELEKAGF